jgi:hypothetical protein
VHTQTKPAYETVIRMWKRSRIKIHRRILREMLGEWHFELFSARLLPM